MAAMKRIAGVIGQFLVASLAVVIGSLIVTVVTLPITAAGAVLGSLGQLGRAAQGGLALVTSTAGSALGFYIGGYTAASVPFGSRRYGALILGLSVAVPGLVLLILYLLGVTSDPARIIIWWSPSVPATPSNVSPLDLAQALVMIPIPLVFSLLGGRRAWRRRRAAAAAAQSNPTSGST